MFSSADVFWKEAAFTLRGLGKERVFTGLSIALLALGIGLTSAVFTLLWQALYARLPVPKPEQIAMFDTNVTHNGRSESDAGALTFSLPTYRYLAEHFRGVQGTIARHGEMVNLQTEAGAQHLRADFVTGNFFEVLGVKAAIGRTILPANDWVHGARSEERFVAMLSYDFWQEAYGGEASAWNSRLVVNGVTFRVIGVAPAGFGGLIAGQTPKIYLPVAAFADVNPGWQSDGDWGVRWLNPFVRLREGSTHRQAEAELQTVYRSAVRAELATQAVPSAEYRKELAQEYLRLVPAAQGAHAQFDSWGEPLRLLQWMTLAVFALAVINVAGLAMVRAVQQRQEMLIRYALGATRTQVMRLHFLQTVVLAGAGGLAGLWIARWGAQLFAHLAQMDRNGGLHYQLHGWTLALHWLGALAGGLLVGLLPAWQTARLDLAEGLNEGALTHSAARSQRLVRISLAAAQIALSLVLAIAAGFFAQQLHRMVSVPMGFRTDHLTVFSLDPKLKQSTMESTRRLWANVERRLQETAGVKAVTYGRGGPFPQGSDVALVNPGAHLRPTGTFTSGARSMVGARYFSTMGIRLIAGREFDDRDRAGAPSAVILNERLAREVFGQGQAIGQTVTIFNGLDPNWLATVVGIAADHPQSWKRDSGKQLYTAAQQATRATDVTYYVRTHGDALREQTIRAVVRAEAPAISAYDVTTMKSRMRTFAAEEQSMAWLVGVFAVLALAMAAAGIYGVVAYGVSLRTVEFGVRVSVGARPADILWLMMREVGLILLSGVILAAPLTYAGLRVARHQLTNVQISDAHLYIEAILLLAACCLAAGGWPAWRATRANVLGALRHQ